MKEIILDGPGKNALGIELMQSLRAELARAGGEPVLMTGAGDAFSAGLNLKEVAELDAQGMHTFLDLLEDLVHDLYLYPGPLVALVNGHAIAGGCVVALCADHRIAKASAHVRVGLNEVALGVRFPPRVLRLARARLPAEHRERVLLGAELYTVEHARELGLVDEVADDASSRAGERLANLARHPRDAYAATKLALRRNELQASPEERARWLEHDLPVWTSPETKERVRAVLRR
jgi:enoyl-CoA hydratase/carnithine racemase